MRVILASQSPRRRQLLENAGYEFEVIQPSETAESGVRSDESAKDLVARFGRQKAEDVARRCFSLGESGVVIGCDTVAEIDGQILGKPRDRDHAEQMLRLLRGREHDVHSGLCVLQCPGTTHVEVVTTTLVMKDIPDQEIVEYLDSGQWLGKSGGFGLQDRTGWLEIRQGSESNVVGLPMELLKRILRDIT